MPGYSDRLPLPKTIDSKWIDISDTSKQILSLKKENPKADTSKLEAEIDQMVYELYGLSEEEIAIVEGSFEWWVLSFEFWVLSDEFLVLSFSSRDAFGRGMRWSIKNGAIIN